MRRKPKQDISQTRVDVKHYSLAQWTDFARHLTTATESEQMRKHLGTCQPCKNVAEMFTTVAEFGGRENSYSPPEDAVRIVRSYFAPLKRTTLGAKQLLLATLTFDSARGMVAEGLRGPQEAPRQLLYVSGNTVVDLRIEADASSERMELGGQVLSSHKPAAGPHEIPVSLMSGTKTVATTATNQFGEFHMSLSATKHLQLLFELQTGTLAVQIPDA